MSQKQHNHSEKNSAKGAQEAEIKIENPDMEVEDTLNDGITEETGADEESSEIEKLKQMLQDREDALERVSFPHGRF